MKRFLNIYDNSMEIEEIEEIRSNLSASLSNNSVKYQNY
jgi:hypothetical protein